MPPPEIPRPAAGPPATLPRGGLHLTEWACELLGTAALLLGGLSAVCLDFGPHSPVRPVLASTSARLLLTGILFAGTGSLVALTPVGRRSGAHLNPAVTLAFWAQGKVHRHDVLGYLGAQLLGALAGTACLAAAWGPTARSLHLGATEPGRGLTGLQAAGVEAAMTAALVLTVLGMTSSARTARWTPLATWVVVALLVWQGAPYTGTSLNPARSLGPALLAPLLGPLWIYLAGPLAGAAGAAGLYALLRRWTCLAGPVTAKLFHDPAYRSTLGSLLPVGRSPDR